jgi:hypothetical protein
LLLASTAVHAGIIFTPHLAEYSKLPPGQYTEATFIYTDIEDVYDRDGKRVHAGAPFLQPGESVQATLALMKFLWIGNVFRDTGIWYLNDRPQFCRVIGGLGWQQASDAVVERSRLFGLTSGGNGLIDLFGLCGFYTDEHHWGPIHANGLWATTVKFPIGRWDQDALLNTGTNYWSYIPQFAAHATVWGRLWFDGTVAYHFHEDNDAPAYGGLTPTRIADWRTREANLAWKFTEHWFVEAGYSYRESVGPNYYDKVTVNFKDPVPAQDACNNTNRGLGLTLIDQNLCNSTSEFFLGPRPGPYADRGIFGEAVTAGFYYIYRTSSVLNLRVFYPIRGRGSQIDAVFDVCTSEPCSDGSADDISDARSTLNGVQEAAAISASPYFELRFVYLFWAP